MGFSRAEIVEDIYRGLETHDLERVTRHFAENAVWELPLGVTLNGREEIRQFLTAWVQAFPDLDADIQSVAESGDRVFVEFIGHGTHSGPLALPQGSLPPTGRKLVNFVCDVLQFDTEHHLVRARTYFDGAELMRQLGIGAAELAGQPVQVEEPAPVH